ncbi:hypothetical protein PWG14_20835 (plasmid) [Chromobacterium amazonense]|uniref:phage tail tube protein n=1 Tax=Chromobacterium amazonense TaxID=1382803 RepID=UPI00237E0509|nr:hypothetical protein [Chromobacterium amazonense]MDE1714938.1 hypothetical protein [Chromobacterium amazonense]
MFDRTTEYFSGQGDVLIAAIDPKTGLPGPYRHLSNVSNLELSLKVEKVEKTESMTGSRTKALSLTKSKEASFKATLDSLNLANLKLALYGSASTLAAGDFKDIALPAGLAAGDIAALPLTNISSLTLSDSAPDKAKTLVKGVDFDFDLYGSIKLLKVDGYVQPFKASGSSKGAAGVAILTQTDQTYALRLQGLNTANGNQPVLVELYRISPDPLKKLDLINDSPASLELEGELLSDISRGQDPTYGYFGRVLQLS